MITLTNVHKTFYEKHNQSHRVLRDISITFEQGKVTALLGENGAGKTTLLRLLSGLYEPTGGEVALDGVPFDLNNHRQRSSIGVHFGSDTGLYDRLTAREHLEYFAKLYAIPKQETKQRITKLSNELGMRDFLNKRVRKLSKGMRQKVAISRAMIHHPSIYLLDEPSTGLDITSANMFREKILQLKRDQKTIVFSTHLMEEVDMLCDDVVILHRGAVLYHGSLQSLYKEEETTDMNMILMAMLARGGRVT
ncbi:ABC transporter ATP-binding protein [Bacillaceae bacterium JMAK1]|nr:ABC transporter ATP-binding protein [Bacillaceae bacterium JMAK1]